MEVVKVLEAKFKEFGIIANPFKYTYRGIKITIEYSKQADKEWLNRLRVLQVQLHRYFGITITFDEPWNQYAKQKKILRVATGKVDPEIPSPKFIDSDNPFLNPINNNWRGIIPFDCVKPEHFIPAAREAVKALRKAHEIVSSYPEEPNFYNSFGHRHDDLALAPEPSLQYIQSILSIYYQLCMSPEIVEIVKKVEMIVDVYCNSIMFDRRLYDRALVINSERYNQPLKTTELRILDDVLNNGRHFSLSKEDQEQMKKYKTKLSQLQIDYKSRVTESTNRIVKEVDSLPGLPERALIRMRNSSGKYNITLQAANYEDIMEYCTDRKLREVVLKARCTRAFSGKYDNRKNCIEIFNTMLGISKLLGYSNTAERALSHGRMRKSVSDVMSFLSSMISPVLEAAKKEYNELLDFARSIEGEDFDLMPWDTEYYARQLREKKFNLNPEELRKYFSYDKMLQGVFWLAKQLYNLDYRKIEGAPVYAEGVEVFEIMRGNQYMGILYIDPFMRSNKSPGAYCDNIFEQGILNVGHRMDCRPVTLIMANFDPTGKMSFDDVQTLLHEFGHSLMEALSEVEYSSQSGNNVYWDYVELASQFMENFAYEREFLDKFATDESGNSIPQMYIDSLKAQTTFREGTSFLSQLEFCYLDMAWFSRDTFMPETDLDIVKQVEDDSIKNIKVGEKVIESLRINPGWFSGCHSTAFSHIFSGGYTAGYYSYKNAEVLAADAFIAFGDDPIHNKEMADRFRRYILSAGDTDDPMELYKKFRGSEPGVDALLKQRGIL